MDNRLLDLVFASSVMKIKVVHSDFPFVCEDNYHPALDIIVEISDNNKQRNFPLANICSFNFHRVNYDDLNDAIANVDWTVLLRYGDVNLALEHFYNKLTHAFGLIIPTKRLCNVTRVYPVWFTSEIITNIKTKDYYRRKWKC
ncbi:hypothetical protein QE152_g13709 [Popillia japonica]|uniref:Uncharacterized protein n=1 Tax=Popillia japonica TaxID=7064 RepID=A0AAW1L950_POPJA